MVFNMALVQPQWMMNATQMTTADNDEAESDEAVSDDEGIEGFHVSLAHFSFIDPGQPSIPYSIGYVCIIIIIYYYILWVLRLLCHDSFSFFPSCIITTSGCCHCWKTIRLCMVMGSPSAALFPCYYQLVYCILHRPGLFLLYYPICAAPLNNNRPRPTASVRSIDQMYSLILYKMLATRKKKCRAMSRE